jgi:cytochrome b subunit of formate dehydrogenase/nitrate/TMAO reductase-like tetraheme cytochrome c subunit
MSKAGKFCIQIIATSLLLGAFNAQAGTHKPKDEECLACHSDSTLTKDVNGKAVSVFVDPDKLHQSIHRSMFSCVDCHKDVKSSPHEKTPAKVTCATCHADAQKAYSHSYHATTTKPDGSVSADCEDCHGNVHTILPMSDPKSPVSHVNIPTTCGTCHGKKTLMEASGGSAQGFVAYQDSVHGKAVKNGSTTAAVCTDCHGTHEILPPNNPASPVYRLNVAKTCGNCHSQESAVFGKSIHGQALMKGNGLAPTCTDCHGIHSIKSHNDPNSSVSDLNLARATCARCHQGVQLTQEFGVPGGRITSYMDSYHGLAAKGGSVVVANCASCHGVHNILPSSDPNSTINPANLDATCGQCHKGVTQKFTLSKVHVDGGRSKDSGSVAVRWIRIFYLFLIFGVIGAMFVHNVIIWRFKMLKRHQAMTHTVERMSRNQRWQHFILLTSFIVLVITGFALKYPGSWFAELLGMGEKVRSITHRVAGVILIGIGMYHVVYAVLAREGRKLVKDLAPAPKDAFDVCGTMLYYLGLKSEKPKFRRFNYAEKAEYWALVWGTGLMAVTGTMMWAKVTVGNLLARWWVDAATAVHFYEAILATLAIVVWHFYQVFFDPDVYPMNTAWRDGKMNAEHYHEEHELDTETLAQGEAAEAEAAAKAADAEAKQKAEEKPKQE